MLQTSISKASKTLIEFMKADVKTPIMLWGASGIGKSSIVYQAGQVFGIPVISFSIADLAPTDLRGLPFVDEASLSRYAAPAELPRVDTHGERGILFFDEINMASPTVMAIAQKLLLERRIGEYNIPEGWTIVAAGNRAEDLAAVYEIPGPTLNRLAHIEVTPDLPGWKEYVLANEVMDPLVLGYLSKNPQDLFRFEPTDVAFPTPRSWMAANDMLVKVGQETGLGLISMFVGEGIAIQLRAWADLASSLPDLEKIVDVNVPLEDIDSLASDGNPSILYAAMTALVLLSRDNPEGALRAFTWMASANREEFQLLFATDWLAQQKGTPHVAVFAKGILQNPEARGMLNQISALM